MVQLRLNIELNFENRHYVGPTNNDGLIKFRRADAKNRKWPWVRSRKPERLPLTSHEERVPLMGTCRCEASTPATDYLSDLAGHRIVAKGLT
jgi:hypothetical protein